MDNKSQYLSMLGRMAFLIVLASPFARPVSAQTDLQIMVSGSWDYVLDPHPDWDTNSSPQKRIVLVAPKSMGHGAYVFSGDDASKFKNCLNCSFAAGLYYLDIVSPRTFAGGPALGELPPAPGPTLPADIQKIVEPAIYGPGGGMQRFAISLPAPDYYSTYAGSYGNGLSESMVSTGIITPGTPTKYTTWMVFHYQVLSGAAAKISSTQPVNGTLKPKLLSSTSIQFSSNGIEKRLGISIVMGAQGANSNRFCDSLSSMSFSDAKKLWGNPSLYALFPEEDMLGNQTGVYHAECIPADPDTLSTLQMNFEKAQMTYQQTLADINELKMGLESLMDSKESTPNQANIKFDGNWLKKETEALQRVRNSVSDLSFGKTPVDFGRTLDCAYQLLNKLDLDSCPGKVPPSKEVVEKYLFDDAGGIVWKKAVGGADCHKAQLNINGVIP
jgi:hypothetical protein